MSFPLEPKSRFVFVLRVSRGFQPSELANSHAGAANERAISVVVRTRAWQWLCHGDKTHGRNYLIGCSWEMRQLLLWAKSFQKQVITFMDIQNLRIANKYVEDNSFRPMHASSELWAFLNLTVTGHGRNKLDAAKELNGLDVWRRIVAPLAPKTVARRVEMYSAIHSPAKYKHIGEITDHLEAWERKIDDFILMGGQRLNDHEVCIIALNNLSHVGPYQI